MKMVRDMDYSKYAVELLSKLVPIHSESQNEKEIAVYLKDILINIGMEANVQHVNGNSYNVIGKLKKGVGERKIILGGHIDTVKPNGKWLYDPYKITAENDKLYGLGSVDMKGGLASQIAVVKKIIDNDIFFDGEIILVGLADEERYSIGAERFVKDKLEANFCIFAEPHFDNIVIGATGKILLNLIVTGESGHASKPESGVNSIDCMVKLLDKINNKYYQKYKTENTGSHCILKIQSKYEGYSLNIPEETSALLNKQLMVNESEEEFIKDVEKIYKMVNNKGSLKIHKEIPNYPSYKIDTENLCFKGLLNLAENKLNKKIELKINQSVSDANIIVKRLNIPSILFGPKGENFHKENEYITKSSIIEYIEVLYDFLIDYLSNSNKYSNS